MIKHIQKLVSVSSLGGKKTVKLMKKYRSGVVRKRSVKKKKSLKSLQNLQEGTCVRVFLNRITDPKPVNFLINDSSAGVFI